MGKIIVRSSHWDGVVAVPWAMIHLLVSLKQSGLWPFLPFVGIPISLFYLILTATQNGGIREFVNGLIGMMDTNSMYNDNSIWVFYGEKAIFPVACFTSQDTAIAWISKTQVSGCLTQYPLDTSVYDWAIDNGYFLPRFPSHTSPEFIQKFTCASMPHYHFEKGICLELEENLEM
jgi:hypothetical protein